MKTIIVGAGASGLMTAISLGRALEANGIPAKQAPVILVDGAKKIGIKILVAGGGRCNVTHYAVDELQYATTKPAIVRSVLKRYSADDSIQFFKELGVHLKREDTGKMFPTTDDAHTVLDALLNEVDRLGIKIKHPWRVNSIAHHEGDGFTLESDEGEAIRADRIVLASGGKALPKSGSDGHGYTMVESLGHSLTDHIIPSLVPLVVDPRSDWIRELSGISCKATISAVSGTGKRLKSFTNDLLCTHFGMSGPGPMDVSRYLMTARINDKSAHLLVNWLAERTFDEVDQELSKLGKPQILTHLRALIPERLASALCHQCGIDPTAPGHSLKRDERRALSHALTECPVFIQSDRGFTHAEVTAGGVPIEEINRNDFRSRKCPDLWLVGEILDIDGRIGGFNFQWAWSTGHIAGQSIAKQIVNSLNQDS